jgi:uncharacterized SAM-binding protein YcdF (DUF218 family)
MVPTRPVPPRFAFDLGGASPHRWLPPRPGVWRRIVAGALGAVALYQAVVLGALWWQGSRDDRRPVDAILVLGAAQWNGEPSPVLRARLDHAVGLYQEGYAPLIAVTGGVGDGDEYSEGDVAAAYLLERGVPPTRILVEDQGRSSLQSIRGAADLLMAQGLWRVLLVSDPPHMLRILRMAEAAGFQAYGSPAAGSPSVGSAHARARFLLRELVLFHGYQWLTLASSARAADPLPPGLVGQGDRPLSPGLGGRGGRPTAASVPHG